jgi:urea transport system permease protein
VAVGKVLIAFAWLALAGARGLEAAPTASGPAPAGAAPAASNVAGDLEALAARLAQPETQPDALQALDRLADPAVERLLRALKDGAIYRWQGGLVLLGDDGSVQDVRGRPLLDAQGKPVELESGQEPLALDEALFGQVQRTLERFEIFGANPDVRRSAAAKLGSSGDPGAVPMLTRALGQEKDPQVRLTMEEALARLGLASPDAAARVAAVRRLGASKSEAGLAQLRALAEEDPAPAVRGAARDAQRSIESYIGFRNLVGWVFNGVSLGAVLLIMSLGLAVTFGLMGIINMAHGEMLMIGSYTAYVVQELFAAYLPGRQDYYFFVALPLSFLTAGLVGLLLEGTVIRFLYGRPLETLIVTWGIGMILQQAARLWFGDQTSVNPPTWFRGGIEVMPGLVFPWSRIFIVALSLAALGALALLLSRTYAGLKVRSVMQNRPMASCLGVSTRRIDAITFAIGTALAGVAGCALALIGTVDPEVGKTYIVDSFMVVVLGGVGKLVGTVVAAFGLGLVNKLLEPAIGGTAAAVYAKVAVLVVVIWFLQWRPTGLFPQRGRAAEAT